MRRPAKRGQLFQVAFAIVFLVFAAVGILLVSYILSNFFAAIDDAGYNETEAIRQVQTSSEMIPSALDFGMVMAVVGLTIGLIITSFLIPSHPIFLVVNIIGIFVLAIACMGLSNMYGEMIAGEGAVLGTVADSLPISVFVRRVQALYDAELAAFTARIDNDAKKRRRR